ncbi:hypothetical protein [Sphingobacterium puteale]|uniref:hypothetical protein n=1 Tax=Sphingobacterium puteale TaxID=2420510 RepID=UPI0015FEE388|nr:hypothetical protein [Sphingobacterium puteale]
MKTKLMIAVCVGVFLHNLYAQNPNSKALDLKKTYVIEKTDSKAEVVRKAVHLIPNDRQYQALKDEFIAFIHFGPNTFTEMYWGRGKEDPAIFDLKELDADQWYTAIRQNITMVLSSGRTVIPNMVLCLQVFSKSMGYLIVAFEYMDSPKSIL